MDGLHQPRNKVVTSESLSLPHPGLPTRATVNFLLRNDTAKDFIAWLKTTHVPDETLFASIIYNPQLNIPGTYNGKVPNGVGGGGGGGVGEE